MKKTMRNKFKKFVPFVTIGALFPIVFSFVLSIDNQHVNKIDNSYNATKEATTYNSINSFNDYQTIANESTMQSISTPQGFFGKTNDNKTVILTSYDLSILDKLWIKLTVVVSPTLSIPKYGK